MGGSDGDSEIPGNLEEPRVHSTASGSQPRDAVSLRFAILAGILAALTLTAVSSIRLRAQGLEYDELHQAPAAFAYVGREPTMFTRVRIRGIPVLNMSYSGAIKSALYGLYMRVTGRGFGVVSWRLTGIVIAAAGILSFCLIARPAWPRSSLALFLVMVVTDSALLLLTRFDWGAVALALLFRLLMLAVWLRGAATGRAGVLSMFGLGALLGVAIFEKLVAVVLIAPLVLLLSLGWGRLSVHHWATALAGGVVGGLPLLVANAYSYVRSGLLVSFSDLVLARQPPRLAVMSFLLEYAGLGQGVPPRSHMLGAGPADGLIEQSLLRILEATILGALLVMVGLAAYRSRRRNSALRWAGALALAYAAVGIGLLLMPRTTQMHHWLVGTPFQYAAVALASGEIVRLGRHGAAPRLLRPVFLAGVGGLIALRGIALISLIGLLGAGRASTQWDPSLTRLGQFAATHAEDSAFVAADWGVATPIYCLADGRPGLVLEPSRGYQGLGSIERWIAPTGKRTLYLVTKRPFSEVTPEATRAILRDVQASPHWAMVPAEAEIADLKPVQVWKFVRQHGER
jgi:hypothetical protein